MLQSMELWPQQHNWLKENLEQFKKVFEPILDELETSEEKKAAPTE